MSIEEQILLLDNLQSLLEKQIAMARRSNFRGVERLAEQANFIVEEIAEAKCFEKSEFGGHRERLTKLYKELELMLTGSKDSVAGQLRQVGNVRKTLAAYSNKG